MNERRKKKKEKPQPNSHCMPASSSFIMQWIVSEWESRPEVRYGDRPTDREEAAMEKFNLWWMLVFSWMHAHPAKQKYYSTHGDDDGEMVLGSLVNSVRLAYLFNNQMCYYKPPMRCISPHSCRIFYIEDIRFDDSVVMLEPLSVSPCFLTCS